MFRVPRSAARLVPSVISVMVTVALITMLGRERYGKVSVLLATGSLFNSLLFHCSRNLIVFRNFLGLRESELGDSWIAALFLSPLVLALMSTLGHIEPLSALLVYIYLIGQSLFERETEYLRSSMNLRGFLYVACARPVWSLVGIAIICGFRNAAWLPLVAFLVVGVSPILACLPKWRDIGPRLNWQGFVSVRNAARVIPMGLMVTVPISYIFVSDALIKLILNRLLERPVFGKFASCDDLIMPASWILTGAFTWDFVPRLLRESPSRQFDVISRLSRPVGLLLCVMLVAMAAVPNVHLSRWTLDLRSYTGLGAANLSASSLSCLIFPALIAIGHRYIALFVAIVGIVLELSLLYWAATFAPSLLKSLENTVWLIVAGHLTVILLGATLLYIFSIRKRSITLPTGNAHE